MRTRCFAREVPLWPDMILEGVGMHRCLNKGLVRFVGRAHPFFLFFLHWVLPLKLTRKSCVLHLQCIYKISARSSWLLQDVLKLSCIFPLHQLNSLILEIFLWVKKKIVDLEIHT